jgi:DNA-directed RNA polymerase subunit beta'
LAVVDARGRELERYEIPVGARLLVAEDQEIPKSQVLCEWNPHKIPILATVGGKVTFVDIAEGDTLKIEKDPSGNIRRSIMDSRGKFHPQIVIEDADGKAVDVHYLPDKAVINVTEGKKVNAGTELAEMPREATGVKDITGGLPRVTEIFEARKPKDPAVVAEIDGTVEISKDRKRGKRSILVKSDSGEEIEHLVPPGKRFLVHSGDIVKAGQALVEGPLVPHDILRVSGEEAVQQYLLHEIQQVYRSQRVEINDKHVEIIIARMLRKVKITNPGDTSLLAGLVMDRFDFKKHNDHIAKCMKVTDPGDTQFALGAIVTKEEFDTANAQSEGLGGKGAKGKKPKPAHAEVQLLGITKAAVQSNSFISAASFQETTKVLTEAALAGKVDRLVGLKENVILGHLIPAGTGFRIFQESEVSYRKEALEDLVNRGAAAAEQQSYPLLNQAPKATLSTDESEPATPPTDAPAFEE